MAMAYVIRTSEKKQVSEFVIVVARDGCYLEREENLPYLSFDLVSPVSRKGLKEAREIARAEGLKLHLPDQVAAIKDVYAR